MLKKIPFHKTYILLGIAFFLVLITAIGVYQDSQNKEVFNDRISDTFTLIEVADNLLGTLIDAETGQRGFLLTNSEDYLNPFIRSRDEIDSIYYKLEDLMQEKPERLSEVQQYLKPRIDLRMDLLEQTVKLHQRGESEESMRIVRTNVGKEAMDDIREYIRELKNREEILLQEYREEMQSFLFQTDGFLIIGFSFILIAIGIAANTLRIRVSEHDRLLSRLEDSNDALLKTRERESLKNKFMGIVAHDLRNPLAIILSLNEIMSDDKDQLPNDYIKYLDYTKQAGDQMNYLIKEMLDVQKIEDGKIDVYFEEVRIYKIISGLIFGHKPHADKKEIELTFNNNSRGDRYKTDKSIFLQVADNLISNAIKYSPSHTQVTITLESNPGQLILTVTDQGPGIKKEDREQLFKRYGKISNRPTGGEKSTGLGLWIVKERVNALGGSITCKSVEGEGASFIAIFPCEIDHPDED